MQAFHNDPTVKQFYLDRLKQHRELDQIIQGTTWDKNEHRGCAVGCTLHKYDHGAYETELGIPRIIARLQDGIFENIPVEEARLFPEAFLSAIPVGADLSLVWPRFAVWILVDAEWGVVKFAKSEKSKKAIQDVADAYSRVVAGEEKDAQDWSGLRKAYAAAYDAADAAAYAAAAYDAYDAAYDAYDAADAAAYAAADAYAADAYAADAAAYAADAAYAARLSIRLAQRDKLLQLLSEAQPAKK